MNQPIITSSDITWAVQSGMRNWDERIKTVIGRLHLADAYLARINVGDWEQRQEKREWLKTRVGPLVREADPAAILGDPGLIGLVRELFGERGVMRLRDRVKQCATPNDATPTTPTS